MPLVPWSALPRDLRLRMLREATAPGAGWVGAYAPPDAPFEPPRVARLARFECEPATPPPPDDRKK